MGGKYSGTVTFIRALPLALAAASLAGCGQGYAIDRLRPKTYLVNPELARFGLAPPQVECVGAAMAQNLSAWQMRLLAMKAGAVQPGGAYPDTLAIRDLLWVASHVPDPKVSAELMRATGLCAVPLVETKSIAAAAPPPEPVQEPADSGNNGPARYRPSEALLQALAAYDKGDFNLAAQLGATAASQGDTGAHQFLGGLYSVGHGVVADPAMAVRLYAVAADHGWSEAMNNLGRAYEAGEGVAADPLQALKWYILASRRDTEDPELVQRNIEHVAGPMSTGDIARAATLAREWEERHGKAAAPAP